MTSRIPAFEQAVQTGADGGRYSEERNASRSRLQANLRVPYWIRAKRSSKTLAEVRAGAPDAAEDEELERQLVEIDCLLDETVLTLTQVRQAVDGVVNGTARCTHGSKVHTYRWRLVEGVMEVTAT